MKKYVKPELFYERFELSQHIADCAWELTNADELSCTANPDPGKIPLPGGVTLFTSADICTDLNKSNYADYCYHGSVSAANSFKS